MLLRAIVFLTLAAVAALVEFGGLWPHAERVAHAAFVLFLTLFVASLVAGDLLQRSPGRAGAHDAGFMRRSSAHQRRGRR